MKTSSQHTEHEPARAVAEPAAPPRRTTYLTDEQLDHFRRRILAMRAEVVDEINQMHERVETEYERAADDLNRLHHIPELNHDVLSVQATRELALLEALDRALERIDVKTYGICRVTGRPIPVERLDAVPYTDLSREAELEVEKAAS